MSPLLSVIIANYNYGRFLPAAGNSSAEAYVVTRAAAISLLRDNTPLYHPSDVWRKMVAKRVVCLYHAFPMVIHPDWWDDPSYASDVTPDINLTVSVTKMNGVEKVIWKLKRLLGKTIAAIVY